MRYSFRLAELLGHIPDPKRRPGTIKNIVEYTGLDRHQIASLLKNEVKYVSLKALSRICDYLIEYGYVSADQLPGALFAVEAENFWELLARRRRIELCVGVRHDEGEPVPEIAWVVASDSVLLGELLNGVSTLGGTAKFRRHQEGGEENLPFAPAPHPEHLKQSLVWSPGQGDPTIIRSRAEEVYQEFRTPGSDRALICLGSTKSNPVVELVVADAFRCEPFQPQDGVVSARERSCPWFLRYRDSDPHPVSCCGGLQLSANDSAAQPGIYYERADGTWDVCPWDGAQRDAAFVFYIHRESQGYLEMALGGFSGRATRMLAKTLATRGEDFWPPVYHRHGVQVGAFIVQFTFADDAIQHRDILRTDLMAGTKVLPLAASVIERRME